jgi:alkanesulfonate monooxygenase SsuD/methylene tetrahydromethanopterin reductase-like flavin-dependent oxidoreductase (luciferase family)
MDNNALTFGLILSNRGPVLNYSTAEELIRLAIKAEESGLFNTVWAGDAFLTNPRLDAITLLAAVAGRTDYVRLGPACMGSFTQRNALDIAYQWASLDQISNGRSLMVACAGGGSGPGWSAEGRNTGVKATDRRRIMWERIKLLRRLWSEDYVDFEGKFHDYEGVSIVPKPIKSDYPIWAATNITRLSSGISGGALPEKTLSRIGEMCDGWMTHSVTPDVFSLAWKKIISSAEKTGKNPENFDNALVVNICVNNNPEVALEEAGNFLTEYYNIKFSADRTRDWTAHGSALMCAETLNEFRGSGVKHIALRIASRDQLGQFKKLANEVLPLMLKT